MKDTVINNNGVIVTTKEPSGLKYDQGKIPLELLDPLALEGIGRVLEFGAKKYAAHNWRGGISYSRLLGAALRHSFAILRGEDVDPESGLPHVDHLGCCWMFLSHMMKTRPDLDDRYKPVSEPSSNISGANSSAADMGYQDALFRNSNLQQCISVDRNK